MWMRFFRAGVLAVTVALPVSQTHAQNFSLPNAQGQIQTLESFNQSWLYVDFWASWCAPCQASFPFMNRLQAELGPQGLQVVAINLDESRADAQRFLAEHPSQFNLLFDSQAKTPAQWGVKVMPTAFLLNPQGEIVWSHRGFLSKDAEAIAQQIQNKMRGKNDA